MKTIAADVSVPSSRAADILVVVDNSSSMLEEQQNLAANFLNQDPSECPLQDLTAIPPEFRNPAPRLYAPGGPLARCGFIQLVAAFDNDFRVAVITTDVGLCDNRVPSLQGGDAWGFRPQRGCLQPDGPPSTAASSITSKVIARADLFDDDTSNDDLAARFAATLENLGTFGSPIERGLDAMAAFLDPATVRHPDCAGDLQRFRRDAASLLVIFVSDEDDCSHSLAGGLARFGDENAEEVCGELTQRQFFDRYITLGGQCYSSPAVLSSVDAYADALLAADPAAKVAVIAGGIGVPGNATAAGCLVGATGSPEGGSDVCFSSRGLSNFTAPGEPCADDTADARGGLPCCLADAGTRYYELAAALGRGVTDSICNSSFRSSMLNIAAFAAADDLLRLVEPADSPDYLLVVVTRADGTEEQLELLGPDRDCAVDTGFLLVDNATLQLCGDGRLGPGEAVRVRARASTSTNEDVCRATNLQASGGGVNCSATSGSTAGGTALLLFLLRMCNARRRRA